MSEYIIDLAAHNASAAMALCDGVHEEIVRCRDCIHRASDPLGEYCTLFDFEDVDNQKRLDGFCAWGVRSKTEQNGAGDGEA